MENSLFLKDPTVTYGSLGGSAGAVSIPILRKAILRLRGEVAHSVQKLSRQSLRHEKREASSKQPSLLLAPPPGLALEPAGMPPHPPGCPAPHWAGGGDPRSEFPVLSPITTLPRSPSGDSDTSVSIAWGRLDSQFPPLLPPAPRPPQPQRPLPYLSLSSHLKGMAWRAGISQPLPPSVRRTLGPLDLACPTHPWALCSGASLPVGSATTPLPTWPPLSLPERNFL